MGPRVLVVQHQDDCPPALVGDWLVEARCELDVRRPYAGDALPDDLRDHDLLLVLGGSMGANDDDVHDWLTPTKALIGDAAQRHTPTLGICLGHQLVAAALGGEVDRNPRGQQLGLLPMGWTEEAPRDDLFTTLVKTPRGVQWNDDIVTALPTGTVVLAQTEQGEVQVARFAPTVWGVQLHPEVDEHILAEWAAEDPDGYAEGVLEDVLAQIADARQELEAGWRPLAESLAAMA
ncbi:MAG: type 1 glutamine amidotransferase [Marmoricola sp.]